LDEHFPNGAKKGFNNRELWNLIRRLYKLKGLQKMSLRMPELLNNEPELRKQVIEAILNLVVVTPKIVGNEIKNCKRSNSYR